MEARANLANFKKQCRELKEQFGGLDLHQIGCLRDHMQKFPELLGAQGMEDHGMFEAARATRESHGGVLGRGGRPGVQVYSGQFAPRDLQGHQRCAVLRRVREANDDWKVVTLNEEEQDALW
eukprot:s5449_g7.t1